MEIESKYSVPSEDILRRIWEDEELLKISDLSSQKQRPFYAVYYDTKDLDLSSKGIAIRVRKEGSEYFVTAKWGGAVKDGLHSREEVNLKINVCDSTLSPDISLLDGLEIGNLIKASIQGKNLVPIVKMSYTRRKKNLVYCDNTIELALDSGFIETPYGSVNLLEMELEHLSGSNPDCIKILGDRLSPKYGLKPEDLPKLARGLAFYKK